MLHGAKKYGGCSIYMFLSGQGPSIFLEEALARPTGQTTGQVQTHAFGTQS